MGKLKLLLITFILVYLQPVSASALGFSGMVQVDSDSYLIVLDKKVYEDGDRVGILKIAKGEPPSFSPLRIDDWKHSDGQASDLESVCRVPGRDHEYLLAEAGYWEDQYGRIFHIKSDGNTASVINVYRIPKIVGRKEGVDGDNFEGMVCFDKNNNIYVVLGERGGSRNYKNGYLRIGVLGYSESSLSWSEYASRALEVAAPGNWNNAKSKRSISDLYLDKNGIIWAVATEDAGNEGPFKSVVYKAAEISGNESHLPIRAINSKKAYWTIDGFKVEALAGPSSVVPGSFMSIGTEDETYMGAWRPLFHPYE